MQIQVRCNGSGKHVNQVDLTPLLNPQTIYRGNEGSSSFPERHVLSCRECAEGKVIITREMIEENRP